MEGHGSNCASKVKLDLNNTLLVCAAIKPRAGLFPITKTEKEDVKDLTKIEEVLWGGTKDEGKNETTNYLSHLEGFVR